MAYAKGKKGAPFSDGDIPGRKDQIDDIILGSGLSGVKKLSDLDLSGLSRINLSVAAKPDDHSTLVIGDVTLMFSAVVGDGANGTLLAKDELGCTADDGCILIQTNAIAAGSQGVLLTDTTNGIIMGSAALPVAAREKYPTLKNLKAYVDGGDGDIVYLENVGTLDLAMSTSNAADIDVDGGLLNGLQLPHKVKHYFMDLSANGEGHADITSDSGVLWLENGPGAKYMHGIEATATGNITVDIIPDSMDAPADRGRRLIFKVVSGVIAGDQLKVEAATHADGDTAAAPDALSDNYNVIASVSDKAGLDPAAGTDIALGQYVLAADSNEGDDSNDHFGLKVTFNRNDAAQNLGLGSGLALHWRVVGA